jgi:CRP-like cAMP-binding protein
MPAELLTHLARDPWFASAPASLRQGLLACARLVQLAPRQTLFARGDAASGLYAVLGGAVRISGVTESGKEALLTLLEPPAWFGEIGVFDGLPRTHHAAAEGAALLCHVPQAPLLALLDEDASHWRHLGLLMALKMRLLMINAEDQALLGTRQRLARRLYFMAVTAAGAAPDAPGTVPGTVPVAQEELARMLGLARQTINALLRELEALGLLRSHYGRIEVLDLDGLRAQAGVSPQEDALLQRPLP